MNSPKLNIIVSIGEQLLSVYDDQTLIKSYLVCSAKNGVGEQFGSECTPRGRHVIRAKIGAGESLGSVFIGRRFTGEIYQHEYAKSQPNRDWILTRILWLEKGKNRLGQVDTMRRYIYIHGAPDELVTQTPSSHGCIRMLNEDVIDLFERVSIGSEVLISE